jgi:hypothetical protein
VLFDAAVNDMMLEITDPAGKKLAAETVKTGSAQITVGTSTLANGIYILRLVDGNRVAGTGKLIVQH